MNKVNSKELVVNWHLTETCNFKCRYCFAKWQKNKQKELFHDKDNSYKLLEEIAMLPNFINIKENTSFNSVRLNLVGGEPLIYENRIIDIALYAKKLGFSLSTITNGSRMNKNLEALIANNFSIIGFSIDSLLNETNEKIGRVEGKKAMDYQKVTNSILNIKKINPEIDIKINTVVSELNYQEDFSALINQILPSKWKVLKMLPILTNQFQINNHQFNLFLEKHQQLSHIISSESNELMTNSYLMLDPFGRFFQNTKKTQGYTYSSHILEYGIQSAFNEIMFDTKKFNYRYKNMQNRIL
ncbi:radical S-adenosyl methionine domain-containing protein 2 [Bisgaardia hudsonensis]|uniref:S-adenosylmethionine-dependent nucleotide dehydratase n=1 Tax=Bisgaardia hudsonensis TaxID=109472 RepID=A0A4R2MXI9_9PAST|nr:viperin family antiviral radical SAM protein [Bisgaardia hudsonensis]QLB13624.1 radical SAM protein [Bisgaardia hudsonensis]TCP11956.1 radical S-adenosyl methionine domain-containing protein 2 [Bisgaardia hudsonensis]